LRFRLSYRDIEELLQMRGVEVDHSTIQRWVFKFSPIIERNMHRRKFQVGDSWRMEEIANLDLHQSSRQRPIQQYS
jgi:putative transposase